MSVVTGGSIENLMDGINTSNESISSIIPYQKVPFIHYVSTFRGVEGGLTKGQFLCTHFYCYVSIGGMGAKNGNSGLLTELYFRSNRRQGSKNPENVLYVMYGWSQKREELSRFEMTLKQMIEEAKQMAATPSGSDEDLYARSLHKSPSVRYCVLLFI